MTRFALWVHGIAAVWLATNGIAHQIAVLWKSHAGTLREGASVPGLLAVGAGLVIAGGVHSWGLGALSAARPSVVPALVGVAVLGAVVAATAVAYGFTFLRGTIAIGVLDLVALLGMALL